MLYNKLLVNLYVLSLDKSFEIFVPVDEKVGNIIKLISKMMIEYNNFHGDCVLFNLYSGQIYNNNDLLRNTDIKNGTKLMLI